MCDSTVRFLRHVIVPVVRSDKNIAAIRAVPQAYYVELHRVSVRDDTVAIRNERANPLVNDRLHP